MGVRSSNINPIANSRSRLIGLFLPLRSPTKGLWRCLGSAFMVRTRDRTVHFDESVQSEAKLNSVKDEQNQSEVIVAAHPQQETENIETIDNEHQNDLAGTVNRSV